MTSAELYERAREATARVGELERQLAEARANVQLARDERDEAQQVLASVREALGAPECVDVREWAQRLTRERDEARAEVERLQAVVAEGDAVARDYESAIRRAAGAHSTVPTSVAVARLREQVDEARAEVGRLRAETPETRVLLEDAIGFVGAELRAIAANRVTPDLAADVAEASLRAVLIDAPERPESDEARALREQVETLTRERDEARDEVALLRDHVCPPPLGVSPAEHAALREQSDGLTRELDRARADVAEERRVHNDVLDAYVDLDQGAQHALGEHATGDTVADVRRLVAIVGCHEATDGALRRQVNGLRTYLDRALRGCDARERKAIETDMAAEVGNGE